MDDSISHCKMQKNRFQTWRRINPKKFALLYLALVCAVVGVGLEFLLRAYVGYDPGYYMGFSDKSDTVVHYPYGDIKINSQGFMDDEFAAEADGRQRLAYIGDSVCTGVGAGHGYRISELLESQFPLWEHMNFGGIGSHGIGGYQFDGDRKPLLEQLGDFDVDAVVYLMNLNDVMPDEAFDGPSEEHAHVAIGKGGARRVFELVDEPLRGRSYLYNFVRTAFKNHLTREGYEAHGYQAFELYPILNRSVFEQTAARVREFAKGVTDQGMDFVIVLLPYEMQISAAAAERYRELGIGWEEGFLERGAQKQLDALFSGLEVIDVYGAFVRGDGEVWENGLGEYFVYNRGDKLDWNHPNREGHARIAEFLVGHDKLRRLLAKPVIAAP